MSTIPCPTVPTAVAIAVAAVVVLSAGAAPGVSAQENGTDPADEIDPGTVEVETDIEFEETVRAGEETTVSPVVTVEEIPFSIDVSVEMTMYVDGEATETRSFEETVTNGTVVQKDYTHTFSTPGDKQVEFVGEFSALGQEVTGTVSEEVTVLSEADDGGSGSGGGDGGGDEQEDEDPNGNYEEQQNEDEDQGETEGEKPNADEDTNTDETDGTDENTDDEDARQHEEGSTDVNSGDGETSTDTESAPEPDIRDETQDAAETEDTATDAVDGSDDNGGSDSEDRADEDEPSDTETEDTPGARGATQNDDEGLPMPGFTAPSVGTVAVAAALVAYASARRRRK